MTPSVLFNAETMQAKSNNDVRSKPSTMAPNRSTIADGFKNFGMSPKNSGERAIRENIYDESSPDISRRANYPTSNA